MYELRIINRFCCVVSQMCDIMITESSKLLLLIYKIFFKKVWKGCENTVNESIGNKLKTLRKSQRLTQQAVADRIGITRATISNYEINRRTPSLKELQKIADFFGVGLDYFGISAADEVLDLLARAKEVFENDAISKEKKEDLYKELMRLYLNIK